MAVKVLIVDDSNFFQQRLREIISEHPAIEVIGVATNGREAVEMARDKNPDIITMDYEMPVMDGVTAVRHIMANKPVPILMFSSLTYEGARITLDALDAGAVDFMTKNFAEVSGNSVGLKRTLHEKIINIARSVRRESAAPAPGAPVAPPPATPRPAVNLKGRVQLLVIGASTGGPVALTDLLTRLPASFRVPILLVQHMPESFTQAFAERLNKQCNIEVKLAADGDTIRPGLALLAPGGKQLMLDRSNRDKVRVIPGDDRVNYKPSVDITFASAANNYGDRCMGVVLTGMGSDGCEGARLIKQRGGHIWSQNKESCVIYGMPMAVAKERLTDRVLDIKEFGAKLAEEL